MYKQMYIDYFGDIDESMKDFTEEDFLDLIKELFTCLGIK